MAAYPHAKPLQQIFFLRVAFATRLPRPAPSLVSAGGRIDHCVNDRDARYVTGVMGAR